MDEADELDKLQEELFIDDYSFGDEDEDSAERESWYQNDDEDSEYERWRQEDRIEDDNEEVSENEQVAAGQSD